MIFFLYFCREFKKDIKMKKLLLLLLCLPFIGIGQSAPQGINYQVVARGSGGDLLVSQALSVKLSIISDITTGNVSWQETHQVNTSEYGLFSLVIGQGASTTVGSSATFDVVDWGASNHLLNIEIDYGNGYINMGTTAFMSTPYALYAKNTNANYDSISNVLTNDSTFLSNIVGDDGLNGIDGQDGAQGNTGLTGAQGNTGLAGAQGSTGTNGTNGIDGTDGTDGIQGITGLTGTNGTDGQDGIQGNTGLTGTNGMDAVVDYDSLAHQISIDSSFIDNVSAQKPACIQSSAPLSTSSTTDVVMMSNSTLSEGTYLVSLNSQYEISADVATTNISTSALLSDLNLIYTDIANLTTTNTTHALAFGAGETIIPGVYVLAGAITIAGTLILDGGGDPNAVFVIRSTGGAITTGAGTNIILTNGATSSNVYWVAQGVVALGVGSTMAGTIISNTAAIAIGASCTLSGRLLTKAGAIAVSSGICSIPTDPSFINMRGLSSFMIYTGSGALANTAVSTIDGNIGTNLGAITGFETAIINGTIFYPGITTASIDAVTLATFSIYSNDILIPNSSRTRSDLSISSDVYVQAIVTINSGDDIEVRFKIDNGTVTMNNRILSFIPIQ